jgi:hypothetical protein
MPRQRALRRLARHTRAPRLEAKWDRDHNGRGATDRVDSGAHALRRVQDRGHAAALHDLCDVEGGLWLQDRHLDDIHGRARPPTSGSRNPSQRRARRRLLGDLGARERSRGASSGNAALPPLSLAHHPVRRANVPRRRGQEPCREPEPHRRDLSRARDGERRPQAPERAGPELRSSALQQRDDHDGQKDEAASDRLPLRRLTQLRTAASSLTLRLRQGRRAGAACSWFLGEACVPGL